MSDTVRQPLPETVSEAPRSAAEAVDLTFLPPGALRFFKSGATLRMEVVGDRTWIKVAVLRTFPLSCPGDYLSVRDGGGSEIGILRTMDGLDTASRSVVEMEVERRYMVSIIRRVCSVIERFGTVDWAVETNRGPCRFTTRDLREGVLRFGPSHFLLTDVESNRFEVPDLDALDARSQAMLLRHL